jgi:hypothetical protein
MRETAGEKAKPKKVCDVSDRFALLVHSICWYEADSSQNTKQHQQDHLRRLPEESSRNIVSTGRVQFCVWLPVVISFNTRCHRGWEGYHPRGSIQLATVWARTARTRDQVKRRLHRNSIGKGRDDRVERKQRASSFHGADERPQSLKHKPTILTKTQN